MKHVRDLIRDWVRTRKTPFTAAECGDGVGINVRRARSVLDDLMRLGELEKGEMLPAKRGGWARGERLWLPTLRAKGGPGRRGPGSACRNSS